MGVYINMEMPKNCSECEFGKPTINCILTWKSYNWGLTHRLSDCPLVEMEENRFYIVRDGDLYEAVEEEVDGDK